MEAEGRAGGVQRNMKNSLSSHVSAVRLSAYQGPCRFSSRGSDTRPLRYAFRMARTTGVVIEIVADVKSLCCGDARGRAQSTIGNDVIPQEVVSRRL